MTSTSFTRITASCSRRYLFQTTARSYSTLPPALIRFGVSLDLFNYTSGRFLYNEKLRLRERHVEFNIAALKSAVEKHVRRGKVKDIVKISEGGFNRILLATMEDGFRSIVKIPYWISVPKVYATASEVATLTFLRRKGIPVPEVYGWSSTAENPVGVEYIIMEHAAGIGADTQWFNTTKYQKHALVTGIVDIETKLFALPFKSIGSIYFKKDLPLRLQTELYAQGSPDTDDDSKTFCIGPTTDYMFWYGKRSELELDRGPCKGEDPETYLTAIANKEIEWIKRFGRPLECDFPHNTVFPGTNSPEDYLQLLDKYLALVPYLLPKNPLDPLNKLILRHPDLTPSNVFLCPDTHQVKCLIDWQHTTIIPLLLTAGYPKLFENPDSEPPEGLAPPKLPKGYDTMDPETKSHANELLRRQTLFYLYRVFNGGINKPHLAALQDPLLLLRQILIDAAGRQWSGNLMTMRAALMRTCQAWEYLPGNASGSLPCPVQFSDAEIQKQTEDDPMWCNLNALVDYWRDQLGGLSEEGWIRSEAYDAAVRKNKALIAEFSVDGSEDELEKIKRGWPFQDREEFF
ncbi:hypothetical protein PRK78_003061 [Emydomyces testavorans]|uniref:Aminoglycoside phosphotransferase domain-containing protein n=1 Tax=Emydomyces testavorans TaxID=2070801 RepID=A0AAF0DFE3_9EURO|nr:hypothetical protein PRK78_003061 [Emydomyces testavorans]